MRESNRCDVVRHSRWPEHACVQVSRSALKLENLIKSGTTGLRGAREAGDRSTLALASSCEAGSEAARPLVAPDGTPAQPIFIREKYPTDSRGHTLGGLATETAHGEERTEAKDGDAGRGAVFESGGSPGTNARASAPRTGSGERAYHRVGGRRSWRERHDRRRRRGKPVRSQRCRAAAPRPHRLSASACARGGCAGACPGREGWLKRRSGGRHHATLREAASFTTLKNHLNIDKAGDTYTHGRERGAPRPGESPRPRCGPKA